ncbi:Tonsoku-like protein [Dissostichus eleginoides]|uniref:Tonsoku-like protein n=1 Tax=Dissostichus eleginoides TaxID=100907 RepID=A0AAD9BHZ4_DISEL|nr:Tonsoku-like protein [Dissostichus eleginoides]
MSYLYFICEIHGDTGSSRSIYTLISSRLCPDSTTLLHFSLTSILSSLIPSSLIHPEVEYCIRSSPADIQT